MSMLDQLKLMNERLNSSSAEEIEELRRSAESIDPQTAAQWALFERLILGKPEPIDNNPNH